MSDLQPENVEAAMVTLLGGLGLGPASTKVPNPRPAAFWRVQRTGGAKRNMVQERAVVLVEAYSTGTLPAWQMAAAGWAALDGREILVVDGVELEERELSLPVNYPDPVTQQARYTFTLSTTVTLKETTP